jgi:nucleotide-binding universal stress UspA family protein
MPMASEVNSTSARQAVLPRRRILLCYDGSAEARRALERVGEIASVVPSRVTVVSVAEPIYPNPPYTGYADPGEEQAHRRLLEEAAEDLRGQGVDTTTLEPVGDPAAAILDAARDGADLVVVGSRHRGLIKRLLFRSVSAEIVVEAPCDVLVVR